MSIRQSVMTKITQPNGCVQALSVYVLIIMIGLLENEYQAVSDGKDHAAQWEHPSFISLCTPYKGRSSGK